MKQSISFKLSSHMTVPDNTALTLLLLAQTLHTFARQNHHRESIHTYVHTLGHTPWHMYSMYAPLSHPTRCPCSCCSRHGTWWASSVGSSTCLFLVWWRNFSAWHRLTWYVSVCKAVCTYVYTIPMQAWCTHALIRTCRPGMYTYVHTYVCMNVHWGGKGGQQWSGVD